MRYIIWFVLWGAIPFNLFAQQKYPYQDASLSVEVRIQDLLDRMTLQEKVDQMSMTSLRHLETDKEGNVTQESLDKTFKGRSIGCLESPFVQVVEIAKLSRIADHDFISSDGILEKDFILAAEKETGHGEAVAITPQDIREVQLAKSAIASGIQILLQLANLTYDAIDALYLAGGFGNYLKPESAIRIGLLPIELRDRIIPVGNTSGAGAVLHLQSELFEEAIEATLNKAQHIELSDHSDFEMAFAMNMYF
ncbi:MAG: DUF4445 domain-containing protein [Marinilabiliaceae bacterium]|nr:DUF4445 domain-containing protein [Marinilabiliaceae bacterium]